MRRSISAWFLLLSLVGNWKRIPDFLSMYFLDTVWMNNVLKIDPRFSCSEDEHFIRVGLATGWKYNSYRCGYVITQDPMKSVTIVNYKLKQLPCLNGQEKALNCFVMIPRLLQNTRWCILSGPKGRKPCNDKSYMYSECLEIWASATVCYNTMNLTLNLISIMNKNIFLFKFTGTEPLAAKLLVISVEYLEANSIAGLFKSSCRLECLGIRPS